MKYFNCLMSSLLFSSFQENTKCESSFFADTCTRSVPIFILIVKLLFSTSNFFVHRHRIITCKSPCTQQSVLLPGGGDIDPICFPRGGALAQFFFPWGGDIAFFFPEMANSPGGGGMGTVGIDWCINSSFIYNCLSCFYLSV
jgi:hypothetical protein